MSACFVTGDYIGQSAPNYAAGLIWNGTKWAGRGPPFTDGELYGVSCAPGAACVTVGAGDTGSISFRWAQNGWSRLSHEPGGEFDAVACPSQQFCVAVGHADNAGGVILTARLRL
jgi:hypothetical protein